MTSTETFTLSDIPPKVKQAPNGNHLKFIVDPSLPGVAKHLRFLGVDCAYEATYSDAYMVHLARTEDRIIITKSKKLVNRLTMESQRNISRRNKLEKAQNMLEQYRSNHVGCEETMDEDTLEHLNEQVESLQCEILEEYAFEYYWVNSIGRKQQLLEIVNALKLTFDKNKMFARCSRCNGVNRTVPDKQMVWGKVHDNVFEENDAFAMCDQCHNITWGTLEENAKQPVEINMFRNAVNFCVEFSYHPSSSSSNHDEFHGETSIVSN